MSRAVAHLGYWPSPSYFFAQGTTGVGDKMQDAITAKRDAIRAALDPIASGLDWSVSDIITWAGSSTAKGVCFQIIHKDGAGVPTGHVWTWFQPLPNGIQYCYTSSVIIGTNSTNWNLYFKDMLGGASVHSRYAPCILYTPDYDRNVRITGTPTGTPAPGETWTETVTVATNGIVVAENGVGDWTLRLDAGIRLRAGDDITCNGGATLTGITIVSDTCYDTGFADHATGTSLTGDWLDSPGVNPYSAFPDFIFDTPANVQPFGMQLYGGSGAMGDNDTYGWNAMVFDSDLPFAAFYSTRRDHPMIVAACVIGDIYNPAKAGDTFTQGSVCVTSAWNGDTRAITTMDSYFTYGDYPAGTGGSDRVIGELDFVDRFTMTNDRNSSQEYLLDIVTVSDNNEVKGSVKYEALAVVGGPEGPHGMAIEDGAGKAWIAMCDPLAVPWAEGVAQWPSGIRFDLRGDVDLYRP